jgi:hypothetical protein
MLQPLSLLRPFLHMLLLACPSLERLLLLLLLVWGRRLQLRRTRRC